MVYSEQHKPLLTVVCWNFRKDLATLALPTENLDNVDEYLLFQVLKDQDLDLLRRHKAVLLVDGGVVLPLKQTVAHVLSGQCTGVTLSTFTVVVYCSPCSSYTFHPSQSFTQSFSHSVSVFKSILMIPRNCSIHLKKKEHKCINNMLTIMSLRHHSNRCLEFLHLGMIG